MARSVILGILLAACVVSFTSAFQTIVSPPITNWGQWGEWERCPEGKFAQGFQVLHEDGTLLDWTALNGLRLYCGNPLDNIAITSTIGPWGDWKNVFYCGASGHLYGFQLRVETPNLILDETASNNIRFFCSNAPEDVYIEGDGSNNGRWSDVIKCDRDTEAICAIRTQVEPDRGALIDDTALNNISFECCDLPAEA